MNGVMSYVYSIRCWAFESYHPFMQRQFSGQDTASEKLGASSQAVASSSGEVVHLSARMAAENELAFTTIPLASCVVQPPEAGSKPFDLESDENGVVGFRLWTKAAVLTEITVSCKNDQGQTAVHRLEIQGSKDAKVARMLENHIASRLGAVRPALTQDAAAKMSDAELSGAHYPPRPDRAQSAEAYTDWLKSVSQPAREWLGKHRYDSRRRYTNRNNNNYAGVETAQPSNYKFQAILGQWVVPNVLQNLNTYGVPGFSADSTVWVGLNNSASQSDLYQAGTEHRVWCFQIDQQPMCASSYSGWLETNIYPWSSYNFNYPNWVVPGDSFYANLWAGDVNGNAVYGGGYLWYYLQNSHNGQVSYKRDLFKLARKTTPISTTPFGRPNAR